jgi:hypothetical protein
MVYSFLLFIEIQLKFEICYLSSVICHLSSDT